MPPFKSKRTEADVGVGFDGHARATVDTRSFVTESAAALPYIQNRNYKTDPSREPGQEGGAGHANSSGLQINTVQFPLLFIGTQHNCKTAFRISGTYPLF